jgi:hypothetical protein
VISKDIFFGPLFRGGDELESVGKGRIKNIIRALL